MTCGCAWIDDVGTIDKSGSYQVVMHAEDVEKDTGGDGVLKDSIACLRAHDAGAFEIFDAQSVDDTIWQIIMYDQVRQRDRATILGVTFAPWSVSEPTVSCPEPSELVGTQTAVTLDGCVRVSLAIGSCKPKQTYQVTGTLTLDAFSTTRRESVSGSIEGKIWLVRYVETGEGKKQAVTEMGDLNAAFQFPVHVGGPWYR